MFTITTAEDITMRFVTKFDPLSVTLRYVAVVSVSKWEAYLVQGSPYLTMKYLNASPIFKPLTTFKSVQCPGDDDENFSDLLDEDDTGGRRSLFGVCSMSDTSQGVVTMRGVQFIFKTQEGANWIMFSSEPMNLEFDAVGKTTISSTSPFTGIIRIAYIPSKEANEGASGSSTGLRRLIYHAGVYPTGGQVSWDFPRSQASNNKGATPLVNATSRSATIHFNYATKTMSDTSLRPNAATNALLMLALPHHAQLLPKNTLLNAKHFDLTYNCIKGPLTPVVGASWSYDEPLLDLEFDGPMSPMDANVKRKILDQLDKDLTKNLPEATENIYGFGKTVARLAQLAHIADILHSEGDGSGRHGNASSSRDQAASLLSGYLEKFLSGEVTDVLLYDSNLGGMVSKNGLADTGEDFGNGR